MRVLMLGLGSAGDIYPQIGIGAELVKGGHDVTLFAQERYGAFAERCGLRAVTTSTESEAQEIESGRHLWRPSRAALKEFCVLLGQRLEKDVDRLLEHFEPGRTLLVGSTAAYAARIVAESKGAPFAFMHLAPSNIRSFERPSEVPGVRSPARMRRPVRRLAFWAADRMTDHHLGRYYNALRERFGLPARRKVHSRENISPLLTLALFPEWFAPRPPDWPSSVHCVGFPTFDTSTVEELDPDLEAWLDAGDPPLLCTIGSFNRQGAAFFETAVAAAERVGRRALIVSHDRHSVPSPLGARHRHETYAPFDRLLPRCALIAHHGGVGTLSLALKHGVPQLLQPLSFDQPDNALRLERLGVARTLKPRAFRVDAAATAMRALLASEEVARQTRRCATLMKENQGTRRAADLLARLDPSRGGVPLDSLVGTC